MLILATFMLPASMVGVLVARWLARHRPVWTVAATGVIALLSAETPEALGWFGAPGASWYCAVVGGCLFLVGRFAGATPLPQRVRPVVQTVLSTLAVIAGASSVLIGLSLLFDPHLYVLFAVPAVIVVGAVASTAGARRWVAIGGLLLGFTPLFGFAVFITFGQFH